MDGKVAVIILLGIFLGSVYSVSVQTGKIRLHPYLESGDDMLSARSGIKIQEASDQITPTLIPKSWPSGEDHRQLDLNYDIEKISNGTRNKLDHGDEISSHSGTMGGISHIDVELDGVTATYPEIGKRYFYENFFPAVIVLDGNFQAQEIASKLGAILADEFNSKVLILMPEGYETALEVLVQEGKIESYELGGWGTGIGKT